MNDNHTTIRRGKTMNRITRTVAAAGVAAAIAVTAAPEAHAMTGDRIFNCGETNNCLSGYYITVKRADGFQYAVPPGALSPNSIQGFYVNQCFQAVNRSTGYVYYAGWHIFKWKDAFISLKMTYRGVC